MLSEQEREIEREREREREDFCQGKNFFEEMGCAVLISRGVFENARLTGLPRIFEALPKPGAALIGSSDVS